MRPSLSIATETVSTDLGYFVVLKNPNDRTSNQMRNGGPERWMHSLIDRYADGNKIAVDIGSCLGFHSAYMSRKFKSVIAFEPQRIIAELSQRSFFLNGIHNIEVFIAACSDTSDEVVFPAIDYNTTKNIGGISIAYKDNGDPNTNTGWDRISYITTWAVRVDSVIADKHIVGFVKIDVEGYEYKALKGMEYILRKSLPPLVIEIKDFPEGNLNKVHGLLMDIGYIDRQSIGNSTWDYLYTGCK